MIPQQPKHTKTRDYFAEMYVAGMLADRGWNVYFPRRDMGFDFIITTEVQGKIIMRPVQVKGKYPESGKSNKACYGYVGKLTQRHKEMILAIAFFPLEQCSKSPSNVAFMPESQIRSHPRGVRCQPALFRDGQPLPRRDYQKYFDDNGMKLMESDSWCEATTGI